MVEKFEFKEHNTRSLEAEEFMSLKCTDNRMF